MHLDVLDLKEFYYRSRLGRAAQSAIRQQVRAVWPDVRGLTVGGFGFPVPLMRPFLGEARRLVALMPGQQGVMRWPPEAPSISVLCRETLWPIETERLDRLVVLHGLETSEHPGQLLDECWRVLAPDGRALFVVPNRAGLWARRDWTPFGFGRPYSLTQLEGMLHEHRFGAVRHVGALYQPPSSRPFWLKVGPLCERIGRRISNRYAGGVLIVEARKVVARPSRPGLPEAVTRPLRALDGIAKPEPKPV